MPAAPRTAPLVREVRGSLSRDSGSFDWDVRAAHHELDGLVKTEEILWLCALNFALALLDLHAALWALVALLSGTRTCPLVGRLRRSHHGFPEGLDLFAGAVHVARLELQRVSRGRPAYEGALAEEGRELLLARGGRAAPELESVCGVAFRDGEWRIEISDGGQGHVLLASSASAAASPLLAQSWREPDCRGPPLLQEEPIGQVTDPILKQSGPTSDPACFASALAPIALAPIPIWLAEPDDVPGPWDFGLSTYDYAARAACIHLGLQGLADLVFLPFILLCLLSCYRARPVLDALRSFGGAGGGPKADPRYEALRQSALLVLDILCVPALLLVLLTRYRSRGALRRLRGFDHVGLGLHASCLRNAAVVLLDLLLFLPLAALLAVTCWRLPGVLEALGHAGQPRAAGEDPTEDPATVARGQLAALDPQWGELAGVEAGEPPHGEPAPPTEAGDEAAFPGPVRRAILRGVGDLAVDLPCILAGVLVICALWRAPALWRRCRGRPASARRRGAWAELGLTLRDLAVTPLLLVLVATVYRLPLVVVKLLAGRSAPLDGEPACDVSGFRCRVPAEGGLELELLITGGPRLRPGSLQVRLLGDGFWRQAASAFGATAASAGQAMLPYALKGTRQTNAYEALGGGGHEAALRVWAEAKAPRKSVVKGLGKLGPACVLVQFEARAADAGRPVLLARLPLELAAVRSALEAAEEGAFGEVPLCTEPVEVGEHTSAVDAYWAVVCLEFVGLVADLFHLLLLLPILLAPWRVPGFLRAVCEPKGRWPLRLSEEGLRELGTSEWLVARFAVSLERDLNEGMKEDSEFRALLRADFQGRDLRVHRSHLLGLRSLAGALPAAHAEHLTTCLDIQDAALHHAALRAFAHGSLRRGEVSAEEHAVVFEAACEGEARLAEAKRRAAEALGALLAEDWGEARAGGCGRCGIWRRDKSELWAVVRRTAAGAARDWGGVVLLAMLLCTLYRVPGAVADLSRERAWSPTRSRFRLLVTWHLLGFAEEVSLALQVPISRDPER